MRVSKKHDVRLKEILDAAQLLFIQKGYESATVNDILERVEIGKGTFYHYFKSKEEVMRAVIDRMVAGIVEAAKGIAAQDAPADEKMRRILLSMNVSQSADGPMIEELHHPGNAQMHQRSIVETIRAIAPILAGVVRQGVAEGIYHTEYPLETVEFLLAANQFIFDAGIFRWTPAELERRAAAFLRILELTLGAEQGSFQYVLGLMQEEGQGRDTDER